MFYQGGNIEIKISGDTNSNLNNNNFWVVVYPHFSRNSNTSRVTMPKDQATVVTDISGKVTYTFNIPYTKTKNMDTGWYDIEVLIEGETNTFRSVFQKTFAFNMLFAQSKDIASENNEV